MVQVNAVKSTTGFVLSVAGEKTLFLSEEATNALIAELDTIGEIHMAFLFKAVDDDDFMAPYPEYTISLFPGAVFSFDETEDILVELQEKVLGYDGAVAQLAKIRKETDEFYERVLADFDL